MYTKQTVSGRSWLKPLSSVKCLTALIALDLCWTVDVPKWVPADLPRFGLPSSDNLAWIIG